MSDNTRQDALTAAKWLVGKGRTDEAVGLLAAWAVQGPNDSGAQELMAEALRINPGSPLSRMAFERMEGVPGDHRLLDEAVTKYNASQLESLLKEVNRPAFLRAQVGFNNNVKYKNAVYHIQTEDSGLGKPHIITHLFADGGRIIKSHKRDYSAEVGRSDVGQHVRTLMKGQQVEMAIMLREGRFDEIIAGRAVGGMELLAEPPRVEVGRRRDETQSQLASDAKPKVVFKVQGEAAPVAPTAPTAPTPADPPPPQPAAASVPVHTARIASAVADAAIAQAGVPQAVPAQPAVPPSQLPPMRPRAPSAGVLPVGPVETRVYTPPYRLVVERTAGGDPAMYEPSGDSVIIGSRGEISVSKERFCHPEEARLVWRSDRLFLEDLPGGNGVFLRIQHLVEVVMGDEFLVGDQLLVIEPNPEPYDDAPTKEPTYFYSSPKPITSAFRVTQLFEGGGRGACWLARGNSVQVGTEQCDMVFPRDPLVSKQHCILEEQAGVVILTDLESRTGVFVRVKGQQELMHGDEIIVGRTRLRVEFASKRPRPRG
jgi:pSer/pThr/pTyr-binding forkhead associated (FHA) protein